MRTLGIAILLGVLALLVGAASALSLTGGGPAHAATITVNTTNDELNSDGDCSLREAIQAANTDATVDACTTGSGADTITLPAGTYTLSLAGASEDANATGDLDITSVITIDGADAASTTIDGGGLDRVLDVRPSGGATLEMYQGLVCDADADRQCRSQQRSREPGRRHLQPERRRHRHPQHHQRQHGRERRRGHLRGQF
jgi:CSLREA domain-containing protein